MDIICSVSHPDSLEASAYGSRDATTLPYASWPITTSNSLKMFSPMLSMLEVQWDHLLSANAVWVS